MNPATLIKNPLMLALDVDDHSKVQKLKHEVGDLVGAVKIGPRLVCKYGQTLIAELSESVQVFVDCKFFDIPSTMVAAVRACFEAGATFVTVHAQAGSEALAELAILEKELNQKRPFLILNVSILTSFKAETLPSILKSQPISQHVLDLADLVEKSGLSGLVCSAEELPLLKSRPLFKVTPGIRFEDEAKGDQQRVMSPKSALELGASAIVVGRPILQSVDPRGTTLKYLASLES